MEPTQIASQLKKDLIALNKRIQRNYEGLNEGKHEGRHESFYTNAELERAAKCLTLSIASLEAAIDIISTANRLNYSE